MRLRPLLANGARRETSKQKQAGLFAERRLSTHLSHKRSGPLKKSPPDRGPENRALGVRTEARKGTKEFINTFIPV